MGQEHGCAKPAKAESASVIGITSKGLHEAHRNYYPVNPPSERVQRNYAPVRLHLMGDRAYLKTIE